MAEVANQQNRNEPCPCGSGLPYQQCCGETATLQRGEQGPSKRQLAAMLGQARQALGGGDSTEAERICDEILKHDGNHFGALRMLVRLRRQANDPQMAERLLGRLQSLYPNHDEVMVDTADYAMSQGQVLQAEQILYNAVNINPRNFQAHQALGGVKQMRGEATQAEYHLRQAHYLHPADGAVCGSLASVLSGLGRHEESERFHRIAHNLQPGNINILLSWIRQEESRGDHKRAGELLAEARRLQEDHPLLPFSEALLKSQDGDNEEAVECLDKIDIAQLVPVAAAAVQFERGHVLDQLQRYDEAFDAYSDANRIHREQLGMNYAEERVQQFADNNKRFYTREQVDRLPRAVSSAAEEPSPVFIVGFPQSGTKLVETVLAAHPRISAGGELAYVPASIRQVGQMLRSRRPYPDCMDELALPGNEGIAHQLRNRYLRQARLEGLLDPGAQCFTDSMPLNELHLGFVHLMFPNARIIHVVRNPLDTVLSCYFKDVRHGDLSSFDLNSCARHYMLSSDLLAHYKDQLDLQYHQVRYEDIVLDTEDKAKQLTEFLDQPWDERCLDAIGDEQEKESLVRSLYQNKHYEAHLAEISETLEPVCSQLGYS